MRSRLLLMLLSGPVLGADAWRTTPLDVYTLPYTDGRSRLTVDWGEQGRYLERKPQQVVEEHAHLVSWLTSPEMLAYLNKEQARCEREEEKTGEKAAGQWLDDYQTQGQKVALGVRSALDTRRVPLPVWVTGIPRDMRRLVQVGIFDASDPSQVRWAVAQRTARPEMHLYAVGWTSMEDFAALHKRHPTLSAATVVSTKGGRSAEDWIADYRVAALPAFVCIDGEELVIEEGGIP